MLLVPQAPPSSTYSHSLALLFIQFFNPISCLHRCTLPRRPRLHQHPHRLLLAGAARDPVSAFAAACKHLFDHSAGWRSAQVSAVACKAGACCGGAACFVAALIVCCSVLPPPQHAAQRHRHLGAAGLHRPKGGGGLLLAQRRQGDARGPPAVRAASLEHFAEVHGCLAQPLQLASPQRLQCGHSAAFSAMNAANMLCWS